MTGKAALHFALAGLLGLWAWHVPVVMAADEAWIYGVWQLSYDPDASKPDYLEFLPNGDVFNIGHDGARISGMYVVSDDRVTAVFSQNSKDVITTFFFDEQHTQLRIVTSKTGKETLYRKQPDGKRAPK